MNKKFKEEQKNKNLEVLTKLKKVAKLTKVMIMIQMMTTKKIQMIVEAA